MNENTVRENIMVKHFQWEHWISLMQLLSSHLAEDGVILDPEEISEKPEDTPPGSPDWDLDHIGQVYLSGSGGFWLAWYGNIPIGHIGGQDLGGVIELRRMYVEAEYRRRGVGTKLVQALIKHCAAKGIRAIELWTNEDGPGRFLYGKLGFCRVDSPGPGFENVEDATGYSPGTDQIRMRLNLTGSDHTNCEKLKEEMMGLVEDVLKNEAPKEDFAERVYDILSRYNRPSIPLNEWDETASRIREIGVIGFDGFKKALNSPHFQTRRFAVRILPACGQDQDTIVELLKKSLTDPNKEVRRSAFRSLESVMDDDSKRKELALCLLPLLKDRSWRIRWYIAWWLADYGYAKYAPLDQVVNVLLDEKDPRVRQNLEYLIRTINSNQ